MCRNGAVLLVLRSPTLRAVVSGRLSGRPGVRFGQTAELLGGWLPGSLPIRVPRRLPPLGVPSSLPSGSPSLLSLLLTALVTSCRGPRSLLRGVSYWQFGHPAVRLQQLVFRTVCRTVVDGGCGSVDGRPTVFRPAVCSSGWVGAGYRICCPVVELIGWRVLRGRWAIRQSALSPAARLSGRSSLATGRGTWLSVFPKVWQSGCSPLVVVWVPGSLSFPWGSARVRFLFFSWSCRAASSQRVCIRQPLFPHGGVGHLRDYLAACLVLDSQAVGMFVRRDCQGRPLGGVAIRLSGCGCFVGARRYPSLLASRLPGCLFASQQLGTPAPRAGAPRAHLGFVCAFPPALRGRGCVATGRCFNCRHSSISFRPFRAVASVCFRQPGCPPVVGKSGCLSACRQRVPSSAWPVFRVVGFGRLSGRPAA